jgi:hypothetical protein
MRVNDAIREAQARMVQARERAQFAAKLRKLAYRIKVFNAQRAHRHPATVSPAKRGKLRRS